MIIETNSRLYYLQLLPKLDVDTAMKLLPPNTRILDKQEESEVQNVKLPTVTNPLNANTASRYQLLTVTDNDLSIADQIIALRPFRDTADLFERAGKLIRGNRKFINAG